MKFCAACAMPLDDESLIGLCQGNDLFCVHCINEDKGVLSCEEIFNGGVAYFMEAMQFSKDYAEKVTRKNMSLLPYWNDKPHACLDGDMLSDDEFKKLFCTN